MTLIKIYNKDKTNPNFIHKNYTFRDFSSKSPMMERVLGKAYAKLRHAYSI